MKKATKSVNKEKNKITAGKLLTGSILTIVILLLSVAAFAAVGSIAYSITTTPLVVDLSNRNFPITVTIAPQSGVVGTLEKSTSPTAAINPNAAIWTVVGSSSGVSTATTETISGSITAIRFTRISGASAVVGEINWPR